MELHRDGLLNSTSSSNESVSSVSSRDLHSNNTSLHGPQLGHANSHGQIGAYPQYNLSGSHGQLNSQSQLSMTGSQMSQMSLTSSQGQLNNQVPNNHGSPINHHGSPIKNRRIVNHSMPVHYATSYRPQSQQHNV